MATVEEILNLARKELGYRESPANSNLTKYGKWYKLDGNPWCMMFVMWVFNEADALALLPTRTASCAEFMKAAKKAKNWYKRTNLKPGDVVIFDFPGNLSTAEHVGIVEELADEEEYVFTIEGNTSTSNQSDGGTVMRRKRKRSLIAGAFRPSYEAEKAGIPEPEPVEIPVPEDANPDADEYLYGTPEAETGDSVSFKGHSQFSGPYDDAEAVPATPCAAEVVAYSRGTAHPYHLAGTGIEGWADFSDVKLSAPEQKRAETRARLQTGFRVEITACPSLRVRSGPGVEHPAQGNLSTGTVVTILEERNGWGRFAAERWISLNYTKKL